MEMRKTSVYLPDDLKARLAQASLISGESEANIIRSALEQRLGPRPRSSMLGSIAFNDPDLASKVAEVLAARLG
jgi:hypothetical protein